MDPSQSSEKSIITPVVLDKESSETYYETLCPNNGFILSRFEILQKHIR